MQTHREQSVWAALVLLVATSFASCATEMAMTSDELANLGPDEGLILGSVEVEGGDDILGRTRWELVATEADREWFVTPASDYTIEASREGEEVVFLTKMPAGEYRFYKLRQPGFSAFEADVDVLFSVIRGRTTYIGKLFVLFPPGNINVFTRFQVSVQSALEAALAKARAEHGIELPTVGTELMQVR